MTRAARRSATLARIYHPGSLRHIRRHEASETPFAPNALLLLMFALASGGCDGATSPTPTNATGNTPVPTANATPPEDPVNPQEGAPPSPVRDVTLPTTAPPFPGYAGTDRCTLIAPLPHARLGLPGPILQCHMERYIAVLADGTTREADVRLGDASPAPGLLHSAAAGTYRDVRTWLGSTVLRGSAEGLHRWDSAVPPSVPNLMIAHTWVPIPGLDGETVVKLVAGPATAWAVTNDAIYRLTGEGEAIHARRFFALGDLPLGDAAGTATGDFCRVAAIDDGRVLLRYRNFGQNALFIVDDEGARPLAVPARRDDAIPPAPPPSDGPMGGPLGAPPGGGGMAAPRVHEPVRAGDRVFVGTADDRILIYDPAESALRDVTPVGGLRERSTANFRASEAAGASGPHGPALLLLNGQPYVCERGPCRPFTPPSERSYAHVVNIEDRAFLALYVDHRNGAGGASVLTVPAE